MGGNQKVPVKTWPYTNAYKNDEIYFISQRLLQKYSEIFRDLRSKNYISKIELEICYFSVLSRKIPHFWLFFKGFFWLPSKWPYTRQINSKSKLKIYVFRESTVHSFVVQAILSKCFASKVYNLELKMHRITWRCQSQKYCVYLHSCLNVTEQTQ